MNVKLKSITPDIETNIVEIARVSSSRKDKSEKPEGLINYLIKNKHWSPFEHGFLTFEITTSKAIGIQLLRHRSFTFQEFSQRYATVTDIEPIELREQHTNNRQSSTDVFDPIVDDYRLGHSNSQLPLEHREEERSLASEVIAGFYVRCSDNLSGFVRCRSS